MFYPVVLSLIFLAWIVSKGDAKRFPEEGPPEYAPLIKTRGEDIFSRLHF